MTIPVLSNSDARRLFLQRHGLGERVDQTTTGADIVAVIERLGFVQIDSINTVERAHHMILHARRKHYRPDDLAPLLGKERALFEHWTHDASVIPMSFYPYWQFRFRADAKALKSRWKKHRRGGLDQEIATVLHQIQEQGPACSRDVGLDEKKSSGGWWDWHPSKTALEYLWRSGRLAVCHRKGFRKYYDLSQRVVPDPVRDTDPGKKATIDWACNGALDRLGFATSGEIAAFWAKISAQQARQWCQTQLARAQIIEIDIQGADGSVRRSFARPDVVSVAKATPEPPAITRILSPFDPLLRDRERALRLFGFNYRIEVFVPKAKRKYGYYVFPVLENNRLIGRIDMKNDRAESTLNVAAFWPETGIKMGKLRTTRLLAAIRRTAVFSGMKDIDFAPDWQQS